MKMCERDVVYVLGPDRAKQLLILEGSPSEKGRALAEAMREFSRSDRLAVKEKGQSVISA